MIPRSLPKVELWYNPLKQEILPLKHRKYPLFLLCTEVREHRDTGLNLGNGLEH